MVKGSRNAIGAHTTREIGRALGQGIYLNSNAGSLDLLLNLNIARTTVEKCLERVNIAVLLYNNTLVGNARDLEFSRSLGEHHILLPGYGTIGFAIQRFYMELLLLWQGDFAGVETLQIGHLTIELGQSDQRVHLIGQQDGLLLTDMLFRSCYLDEQVTARNSGSCGTHLSGTALWVLTLCPTLLSLSAYLDMQLV